MSPRLYRSIRMCAVAAWVMAGITSVCAQEIDWISFPAAHQEGVLCKGHPFKFANSHATDYDLSNSGLLDIYSDGSFCWTVGLRSESAKNMNAVLSEVSLAAGDRLSAYCPDSTYFEEITWKDVPESGVVQLNPVPGKELVISVIGRDIESTKLKIASVNCGFLHLPEHQRDIINDSKLKATAGKYGSSEECEVDASCVDEVKDAKQSVCRLIINGSNYGTGVLVNNTANDGTPYILTAAHVLDDENMKSIAALFNFETPICQDIEPAQSYYEKMTGGSVVVYNELRDMVLIKFDRKPLETSRAYWSGWNLSTDVNEIGTAYAVHHPYGDVRKVSICEDIEPEMTYNLDKTNSGKSFDPNNHWRINEWIQGTTEGGSSGCPLFDSGMHVIGNLTGGEAYCSNSKNDYFWMLSNNWDALMPYLDPNNTGKTSIEGAYYNKVTYGKDFPTVDEDDNIFVSKLSKAQGHGYVSGHNAFNTKYVAQKLGNSGTDRTVYGVYLTPFIAQSARKQQFDIVVWEDNNGVPGKELYSQTVKTTNLLSKKINYLNLDNTIDVQGEYHVGVKLNYYSEGVDTLGFYCQKGSGGHFYAEDNWHEAGHFGGEWDDLSVFIGTRSVATESNAIGHINSDVEADIANLGNNKHLISGKGIQEICVYNISGHKIKVFKNVGSKQTVNLNGLPTGIYMIGVHTSKGDKTFKTINR